MEKNMLSSFLAFSAPRGPCFRPTEKVSESTRFRDPYYRLAFQFLASFVKFRKFIAAFPILPLMSPSCEITEEMIVVDNIVCPLPRAARHQA